MIHSESSELCFATSSRVICAIFEVVDRAGYCLRIWYNVPSKLCNNYSSKILGICRRSRGSNREEYKKKKGREQKYKVEETLGGELNSLPRILLYGASASFYDSPIDGRALEVMTHSQSSCVRVRLLDQETLYNHMWGKWNEMRNWEDLGIGIVLHSIVGLLRISVTPSSRAREERILIEQHFGDSLLYILQDHPLPYMHH